MVLIIRKKKKDRRNFKIPYISSGIPQISVVLDEFGKLWMDPPYMKSLGDPLDKRWEFAY